jgi:hypothetical protein
VSLLLGISKHGENDVRGSFVALKVFCTLYRKLDLDPFINGKLTAVRISFPVISLNRVCKDFMREELWGTLHLNSGLSQYFLVFWSLCTYPSQISGLAYTGHFIMFSVITKIYNEKTKGPTLMELFTVTGNLKQFFDN